MAVWNRPEPIKIPKESDIDPVVKAEIESFNKDRERVRLALQNLGGREGGSFEKIANTIFMIGILFVLVAHYSLEWIGDVLSLELGLLLISVKILWMIRNQMKYQHFLFWMLHSIEFRQNEILKRLDAIEGERKVKKT